MRPSIRALLALLPLLAAASCSREVTPPLAAAPAPPDADADARTNEPASVPAGTDVDAKTSFELRDDRFDDGDDEYFTCSLEPESPSVVAARLGHSGGYDLCGG